MVLLLCFVAAPAAVFSLLQHQKYVVRKAVKHRMMAGMDRSELTLLAFSEAERQVLLTWEHDAEFEYKGQMYDVVDTEKRGDTTLYWVWPDAVESALNRQLRALVYAALGQDAGHRERHEQLVSFFKSLFAVEQEVLAPLYTCGSVRSPLPPALPGGRTGTPPPIPPPR